MVSQKPAVLLILGAHRSGTSSLAGTLACLGAALPQNLMPPSPENVKGYFEPSDIVGLHDLLFARVGTAWDDIAAFPAKWYASPDFQAFVDDLSESFRANYGDAPLAVLKDPRINRLIPLWEAVFQQIDAVPKVVIITRNPLEVARSLQARDRLPLQIGLLIWLRNQLDAEQATRHLRRVFVSYDDLMQDWRAAVSRIEGGLDLTLPGQGALAHEKVDGFLDASLRHHRAGIEHAAPGGMVSDWAHEAFRILSHQDSDLSDDAKAALDQIRAQLDAATQAFGPLLNLLRREHRDLAQGLDVQRAEAHQRQADLHAEIGRLQEADAAREAAHHATAHALTQSIAERDARLSEREGELLHLRQALAAAEAVHQARQQDYEADRATYETALADLRAELGRRQEVAAAIERSRHGQLRDLARQVGEREDQLESLQSQIARLERHIEALSSELSAVYASPSWRFTAPLRRMTGGQQDLSSPYNPPEPSAPSDATPVSAPAQEALDVDPRALFDITYYLDRYSDVRLSSQDPWDHFVTVGISQGRDPNPLFKTTWYLEQNPDAAEEGLNPLVHYLTCGAARGSNPSPDFDGSWYQSTYPDVGASGMNPLLHYLDHGRAEGRLTKAPDAS